MADDSDNNSESFSLNLDSSDFIEQALSAKDAISGITDVEGFGELASKIMEVGAVVGVLGTAFFAIKETMDLVFDAENINAVNQQFDILSRNAGVYGDNLKEALVKSASGWADETEVLTAANKAMVELQGGVEKLPQVMELAKEASSVMGGSITQNFEQLTQAIASGQTRQLRSMGIIVDQQKAYQDYAKSIGVTVSELSQAGKQQAMMNAVLEQGKTAFAGIDPDIRQAQTSWMQLKSTLVDVADNLKVAFAKYAGPVVELGLKHLVAEANLWKKLTSYIAGGSDQAKDSVKAMNDEIAKTRTPASTPSSASSVDTAKQLQDRAKFNEQILKLDQQLTQSELSQTGSVERAEQLYNQQRLQDARAIDNQIAQIRAQAAAGQGITQAQADQEIIRLNKLKTDALIADEQRLEQVRQQSLDTYANDSKNVLQGITRGAQAESNKAAADVKNFSNLGRAAFQSFSKNAVTGLEAIGSGAQSAGDAMKGFMLGSLADIAEAEGKLLLGSALLNPANAVEGAALLVLAGFLRSQAGSSASSGGGSSGGSSSISGSNYSPFPGSPTDNVPIVSPQNQGSQVNITIQGHLLAGQESQNWLVNTIRQATDGSDFNINSVS